MSALQPPHERTSGAFVIPVGLLYGSLAVGLLGMMLLCSTAATRYEPVPRGGRLIIGADPAVWQMVYALVAVYGLERFLAHVGALDRGPAWLPRPARHRRVLAWLAAAAVVASVMVAEYVVQSALEESFSEPARQPLGSEGRVSQVVLSLVSRWLPHVPGGAPSGFGLRQVLLSLIAALAFEQHSGASQLRRRARFAFYGLTIVVGTYVMAVRVYQGLHTWFDMGIGLGLGVYGFWMLVVAVHAWKTSEVTHVVTLTGVTLVYVPLFFFYSRSSHVWIWVVSVLFPALGLLYHWVGRRQSHLARYREVERRMWR